MFEGLFPTAHDSSIQCLLFQLSEWHALAKPRMHTDDSLALLQQSLWSLGDQLHHFQQDMCEKLHAHKLPTQAVQQQRREMVELNAGQQRKEACSTLLPKKINLDIYKFHALGDYVTMIKMYGTTDSFTTQVVSEHQVSLFLLQYQCWNRGSWHTAKSRRYMDCQTRRVLINNFQNKSAITLS